MPWRHARQTRVFVLATPPFEGNDWCEQVLGRVVLPLFRLHHGELLWLWFTTYVSPLGVDDGDCDISKLPEEYLTNGVHRSVRVRLSPRNGFSNAIEANGLELIKQAGCFISDWRGYDVVNDLGGDRFAGARSDIVRRTERAKLMVDFLHATCCLALSCLTGPDVDGKWQFEDNPDPQNPHRSSFESIHHVFCNMTAVPLYVLLFKKGEEIAVGTRWHCPESPPWQAIAELPIGF